MAAFRSALYIVWMALTVVPWGLAVVLAAPFVRRQRLYWMCVGWLRTAVVGGRAIAGIRNRVQGMQHLPAPGDDTPTVLLVKHQSAWETFVMPTLMPHPLAYVFKKELLRIPFFGWALGRLDMVHIDRSQRVQAFHKVVEQGRRLMAQGVWVIMFPEGTRTPRGAQGAYKSGGARLAVECGAQVIPVAVTSARCWPPRALRMQAGVVDISIGPPIASQGRSAEELIRQVQDWIESEMRRLDPDAYPAAAATATAAAAPEGTASPH